MFELAVNDISFVKAGFFGFMGSGKTETAARLMAGLHKYMKATKPIYFLDTEKGSAFVKETIFDPMKIPLMVVKTRAFKDLKPAIEESQKDGFGLIVDSISHPWYELCSAYLRNKKSGGKFIAISDWQIIKDIWRNGYSEPFVNAKIHIAECGRASNIFQDIEDVDASEKAGKEVYKSVIVGTKMRTESEAGYEPYLLCEMEKVFISEGGKYARRCSVIKDKWRILDSKTFDDPTFEDFLPHIQKYNLSGQESEVKMTGSEEMFTDEKSQSWWAEKKARTIVLEEVEGCLVAAYPGQSAEEKRLKVEMIRKAFGGYSWSALQERNSAELNQGLKTLHALIDKDRTEKQELENEKSKSKTKERVNQ